MTSGQRSKKLEPTAANESPGLYGPAYFLSLQITNLGCFGEEQTLDLSDGEGRHSPWTILLGENGTGKTTILQTLVALKPIQTQTHGKAHYYPLGWKAGRHRSDDPGLAYWFSTMLRQGSEKSEFKVALIEKAEREGNTQRLSSIECNYSMHSVNIKGKGRDDFLYPSMYTYGAGRRLARLNGSRSENSISGFFLEDSELIDGEEWLFRLDYSASRASRENKVSQQTRLNQVTDLLLRVLPGIENIRFDASSGPNPKPTVEFKTLDGWVSLWQLGYGYRTMIAWMVDFVSRMVERYPDSPDPLAEAAVVLVDEIDLHLHPAWQRSLIGFLSDRFPKTQFIVTAHSPLVVQAAAGVKANIALLRREGDHVVIENDLKAIRGWRVDQILTSDLFGLPSARPPELDKALARRKALLTKARLSKADKNELAKLETQIGDLPTGETYDQAQKYLDLVEETQRLLHQNAGRKP